MRCMESYSRHYDKITNTTAEHKKQFYESATQNILSQLEKFGLSPEDKRKAVFYTKLFREAFKYDEIKKHIFITPESKIWDLKYDSAGFCRIASITFAIIMGIKDWQLMCIGEKDWNGSASHHYLKHLPSGKFFDITYDQFAFEGHDIPYDLGHSAVVGLTPGDMTLKFADTLDIDLLKILKGKTKGK